MELPINDPYTTTVDFINGINQSGLNPIGEGRPQTLFGPALVNSLNDNGKTKRIKFFGSGHIVGTYRMGTTKGNSVVNSEPRSWDHPNLFLVGSGVFPTVATGNPTLTSAALSLWAAQTIKKDLG